MLDETRLRSLIRDIPDFPEPGILFRDITPLLHDAAAMREVNDQLATHARAFGATLIAGIEARGFLFGTPVAERLGVPFVPVRKPGKLPAEAASVSYALEYGEDALEMHRDPGVSGHRVAIIDDLLATGGTAAACAQLVESCGGIVAGAAFVLELGDLGGRGALEAYTIVALTTY